MQKLKLFTVGSERFRIGPWHADHSVAYIGIDSRGTDPTPGAVQRCVEHLHRLGFTSLITAALPPSEAHAFRASGFSDSEALIVLRHDLAHLPPISTRSVRRTRPWERGSVLRIDDLAFSEFWKMDRAGLSEALDATASVRFTVAQADDNTLAGYAICGLTQQIGYLQRLAVRPDCAGHGYGRSLVLDGMKWLRRRSAHTALVNTQEDNAGALDLYRGLGFELEPQKLVVLSRND